MEEIMVWIWLAVTVIAAITELATIQFVSLWFAVGGIVGIAFSFIPGLPWWGEIIIFAVISSALLFALRPIIKKKLMKKTADDETNLDRIIGKKVRMITEADFDNMGSAKVGDVVWSVKSEDGSAIAADEVVSVIAIDGNKLIVRRCD